ncbi:glycosyltransferase [Nocardioides aurantiacus]|uniref:glycosyltransferase n=1 Tax=Nocardioides aurantiacus TaxID=86796 RepID=UPI00403FA228
MTATTMGVQGAVQDVFRSPEHRAGSGRFEVTVAVSFASNAGTIAATIESLVAQTSAPHFELLLVSNATTDNSLQVAREASAGLPTRIVRCESVGYDANARNVSMSEAAAEKILFLDADDIAQPSYVARMCSALDEFELVTGVWSLKQLNSARFPELLDGPAVFPEKWPFRQSGWTYAPAGTLGVRRSVPLAIGGFRADLSYAANNEWCFRAFAAGYEIAPVYDAVVEYRLRPSLAALVRQHYRWGVWSLTARSAAQQYGLPTEPTIRALPATLYFLGRTFLRIRSRFDAFQFVGAVAGFVGSLQASTRRGR